MIDKLPPQDIELEKLVLGALMLESHQLDKVRFLKPEMFYDQKNYHVMQSILNLKNKREPVDLATVLKEIRSIGRNTEVSAIYLSQLTSRVGSAAHVESHARMIQSLWVRREVIMTSTLIQGEAYADDAEAKSLVAKAIRKLADISQSMDEGREVRHISTVLDEVFETFAQKEMAKKQGLPLGVVSGISDLDQITIGWQKADFIVIGARPSMGKTAYGLGCMLTAARNNFPTLFFSLEMPDGQLVERVITGESEVSHARFRNVEISNSEFDKLWALKKAFTSLPIHFDQTSGIELSELCAKARRLKQYQNIGLVIIDHMHLIRCSEFKRDKRREIGEISRTLKELAKELNIPVIALAQLSRSNEQRKGQDLRPRLSDLRETGDIEQDADLVVFIHRPEYYGIEQTADGNSTQGLAEMIIAKHRNGATGIVECRFIDRYAKFVSNNTPAPQALQPNTNFLDDPF